MLNRYFLGVLFFATIMIMILGCGKSFLDPKSSSSIISPTTIKDYQNLLENNEYINAVTSGVAQLSADEYYYLDYEGWTSASTATERESYIWGKDVFGGETERKDWNYPYTAIFYGNIAINGLPLLSDSIGSLEYNFVLGWAYFIRAYNMYQLVRDFSPAYDSATANIDLGIPLKLSSGIDEIEQRSTVSASMQQIFSDLDKSLYLLPSQYQQGHPNRPSKTSAFALKARILLYMRKYEEAGMNADSSLSLYKFLTDYNTITSTSNYPFNATTNYENLYSTIQVGAYPSTSVASNSTRISIDTNLLAMYDVNDLRKTVFFKNGNFSNVYMRGSYHGSGLWPYTGLAVDEMYLIRAEYFARSNKVESAVSDINTLLLQRYRKGTYKPIIADTVTNALQLVLKERRKELVWRGLRWSDLKRLNKEGANITLSRILNGQTYTLQANDSRYVFNIPADEMALSSIQQNVR